MEILPEDYSNNLADFYNNELTDLGDETSKYPLAYNLLQLMNRVQGFEVSGNLQMFYFTDEASIVFNRQFLKTSFGSVSGFCNASEISTFDKNSGVLTTQYSFEEYSTSPLYVNGAPQASTCETATSASRLGYFKSFDGDNFRFKIDMQSFSLALGINLRYASISSSKIFNIEKVDLDSASTISYKNVTYDINQYINTLFPKMDPVYCLTTATNTQFVLCTINIGGLRSYQDSLYAFPVLNHGDPGCQQCPNDPTNPTILDCDSFAFLAGLAFYETIEESIELFLKHESYAINQNMFYSHSQTFNGLSPTKPNYTFCDDKCTMVTILMADTNNKATTEDFHNLYHGSCTDTVTLSSESAKEKFLIPPTSLVENYVECRMTPFNAFINAIGIAFGNAFSFAPPALFCLIPIMYLYLNFTGQQPPKERYTKEDKLNAALELSTHLLVIKDRDRTGFPSDGVVLKLSDELVGYHEYKSMSHNQSNLHIQNKVTRERNDSTDGSIVKNKLHDLDSMRSKSILNGLSGAELTIQSRGNKGPVNRRQSSKIMNKTEIDSDDDESMP